MQVHFQFLSQALQKVQPVAQSCLAEALAQAQERCANARSQSSDLGPLTELEEASRSWKGAAQVCSHRVPQDYSWSGASKIWDLSLWYEQLNCLTFLRRYLNFLFPLFRLQFVC